MSKRLLVSLVVGGLVLLAIAVLSIGCHAPSPQPPAPWPATCGDTGERYELCNGALTPTLARCIVCEKASGCYVDDAYCVSHLYSCGDPFCGDGWPAGAKR